jgi:6-phosphogluconolactonase
MADNQRLIVSTLTDDEGIFVYRIADADGRLEQVAQTARFISNPFYIDLHPNGNVLYAITDPGGERLVSALSLDRTSGEMTLMNQQPTGGGFPCYVAAEASGRAAVVANYEGGSVSCFPLNADGTLAEAGSFVQHVGCSIDESRQKEPHAHCFSISADGRFAFAADLGTDQVMIYALDAAKGTLTPGEQPFARVLAGGGPRHFTISPDNRHGYVCNEMGNTVTAFKYDAERGLLLEQSMVPTLPTDFDDTTHTADVVVTPDGRFVYCTNRGHNSLAMYTRDADTGALEPNGFEPSRGVMPQNITITPDSKLLFIANTKGDNVVAFHINGGTGKLEYSCETKMPAPVCGVLG